MIIFCIVIIAFMVGLNNLYWYYETSNREQVELTLEGIFSPTGDLDCAEDEEACNINAESNFGT